MSIKTETKSTWICDACFKPITENFSFLRVYNKNFPNVNISVKSIRPRTWSVWTEGPDLCKECAKLIFKDALKQLEEN